MDTPEIPVKPILNTAPEKENDKFVSRAVAKLDASHEANLAVPVVSTWEQRRLKLDAMKKGLDIY